MEWLLAEEDAKARAGLPNLSEAAALVDGARALGAASCAEIKVSTLFRFGVN